MKLAFPPGLAALVVGLACSVACSGGNPTTPSPPDILTNVFEGSVGPAQVVTHPFTVAVQGPVIIVMVSLALSDPENPVDEPPILGMAIGTWDGATCSRVSVQERATPGTTLTGTALPGDFCVDLYDPGSLPVRVNYSVSVQHS